MDWKVLFSTFGAVFLAELGDKTQLATLALAAGNRSRWLVFIGAATALVCTSLIAVLAAEVISRYLPPVALRRAAALLFIVLGAWMMWKPGSI